VNIIFYSSVGFYSDILGLDQYSLLINVYEEEKFGGE
jgi:hypothetical protein